MLVMIAIKRMFKYSDMKIRAKPPLAYSVLNPDTNSLFLPLQDQMECGLFPRVLL